MLKIKKTAVIALAVGAVMLTTAAMANFATSNGYNIYKESVRKLFDQDNYSAEVSMALLIDDEELAKVGMAEQYDKASGNYFAREYSREPAAELSERVHEMYYQDGILVTLDSPQYNNGKYEKNTTYGVADFYKSRGRIPNFSKENFIGRSDDEEMFDKYYNFASAIADLFVGDIKNNFVITSAQDGLSTYEANLDLFQIPEVVNAGTDLIVSQLKIETQHRDDADSSSDDLSDLVSKLSVNPFVSGAKCTFTVDDEGRLINNVLTAEISGKDSSGESHTLKIVIEISCGDYGTTVPARVDLDKVEYVSDSQKNRQRLEELKIMLDGELRNDLRDAYEREYGQLQAEMDYYDEHGMIDPNVTSIYWKNGEVVVSNHIDTDFEITEAAETITVTTEE